uniref:Acetyl/acyl transferase related protein n=1 Tax=uncultured haloarchaeon TaxID=160804 RepID=A5YSP5_9EURY|nr:acetyl/acyl transferase related protein [uncultured haloarchaeon]
MTASIAASSEAPMSGLYSGIIDISTSPLPVNSVTAYYNLLIHTPSIIIQYIVIGRKVLFASSIVMDQDELVLSVEASPVTEDNGIAATATVGVAYSEASQPPEIGPGSTIRGGTTIYDDVVTGSGFQTGHNALVREQTVVGEDVLVGTNAVIDGKTEVGDSVSLQTGVYIPQQTTIGSNVFCGPSATLLNDPYPARSSTSSIRSSSPPTASRIASVTSRFVFSAWLPILYTSPTSPIGELDQLLDSCL